MISSMFKISCFFHGMWISARHDSSPNGPIKLSREMMTNKTMTWLSMKWLPPVEPIFITSILTWRTTTCTSQVTILPRFQPCSQFLQQWNNKMLNKRIFVLSQLKVCVWHQTSLRRMQVYLTGYNVSKLSTRTVSSIQWTTLLRRC